MRLQKIGSFDSPVYVTSPPGDKSRLFVVEQGGTVRVVKGGKPLGTPFLDVSDKITTGGEQGLLSIAFAPDYASSGLFYVYYTDNDGDERGRRVQAPQRGRRRPRLRAPADPQVADPSPTTTAACCCSGPTSSSTSASATAAAAGDQHGARGNAQSLGTLLGKILRIDPRPLGVAPVHDPAPTTRS